MYIPKERLCLFDEVQTISLLNVYSRIYFSITAPRFSVFLGNIKRIDASIQKLLSFQDILNITWRTISVQTLLKMNLTVTLMNVAVCDPFTTCLMLNIHTSQQCGLLTMYYKGIFQRFLRKICLILSHLSIIQG